MEKVFVLVMTRVKLEDHIGGSKLMKEIEKKHPCFYYLEFDELFFFKKKNSNEKTTYHA